MKRTHDDPEIDKEDIVLKKAKTCSQSQDSDIYIYRAMSQQAGHRILLEKLSKIDEDILKENDQALWLLRESRYKSMLTIDYLIWDKENNTWTTHSTRMLLSNIGWINADEINSPIIKEARKTAEEIDANTASQYENSLIEYIETCPLAKFIIANRMNPAKHDQSTSLVFSGYQVKNQDEANYGVILLPGVKQAITCEITGQCFRNPVVMKECSLVNLNGSYLKLYSGRSYEKSQLIMLGVKSSSYYENRALKSIINRLGAKDSKKIELLIEDCAKDAVTLETYLDSRIIPSGQTYSLESINNIIKSQKLECPITRKAFTKQEVITNVNVDYFILEWPANKDLIINLLHENKK